VAPLTPETKQVGAVRGVVELALGRDVRLRIFTNSARTLKLIDSLILKLRPTLKFSVGCR
jgi:DNA repair photolyase